MKRQVTYVTNLGELNAACLQNGCTTGAELEERAPWARIDWAALSAAVDEKRERLSHLGELFGSVAPDEAK